MRKLLWNPSEERIREANITKFTKFVNQRYGLNLSTYWDLYKWSIGSIPDFWASLWDYADVIASKRFQTVVDDLQKFPGAKWFVGARLNFAENLLRRRDKYPAFIFRGESEPPRRLTYSELYGQVSRLAGSLRRSGVKPGDRVVGYMPNIIETAVAMLAATAVGATWASCGADLGPQAVLDRFSQIKPKVLLTVDGYVYKGKTFDTLPNAMKVVDGVPSIKRTVVIPYSSQPPYLEEYSKFTPYEVFLSEGNASELKFEQLPSDHPVYIMFSSGTTGKPKCMVQGAAGILLNHLKELVLHADLKPEDRITYITSPSWMMWNWLMSSLAVGATIVLFDGNPNHPTWETYWRIVQDEQVSILGCSASYLNFLKGAGATPGKTFDLSALREISQTGSPLSAEGFEWVYGEIKQELHFNSISGGTDINGCFAGGSPTLPVYAGELQAPGLAMKIAAYDENGNPVLDQQAELVCEAPSPSMPLYFWDDPTGEKYRSAYFDYYKSIGKNVWRHGDYIIIHSDTGGVTFLGRSDSVLKPSGVRIGTSEIYRVIETIPEIADSLAVGQSWKGDERVILFVQMASGHSLTPEIKDRINRSLRENASPRHVPAIIIEAPSIPYTFSMKKVESAVRNIVNGKPVTNRDALVNPDSLEFYEKILPTLQSK